MIGDDDRGPAATATDKIIPYRFNIFRRGTTPLSRMQKPLGTLRRALATALAVAGIQTATAAMLVGCGQADDRGSASLPEAATSYEQPVGPIAPLADDHRSASLPAVEAGYKRPFGPRAPWNVPVAGLPTHPDSQCYVERLWRYGSERPGNINLTFEEYTYPVYDARFAEGWRAAEINRRSSLDGKQIPWHRDWRPASGSDGQVIILDPDTGREWDLWQVEVEDDTVQASNGNLVPGNYWTRETGFAPSRGAGIPYLAMLVRPAEVAQELIPHALSMAARGVDRSTYVPPATGTDGEVVEFAVANGIPEGMRFALRVTDAEIEAWVASLPLSPIGKQSARAIGRALRDYGWFITDNGGAAHLQFEDRLTAGPAWSSLGLDHTVDDDKTYPRDLLDGLVRKDRIYAIVPSDEYPAALRTSADGGSWRGLFTDPRCR